MRNFQKIFSWVSVLLLLAGCSGAAAPGSGTGSASTLIPIELPGAQTFTDLPNFTGPVVVAASGNLARGRKSHPSQPEYVAAGGQGILINWALNFTTTAGHVPKGGCIASAYSTDMIFNMTQSDYYMCLFRHSVGSLTAEQLGFDVFDGSTHYIELVNDQENNGVFAKYRVHAARSGSRVTELELAECDSHELFATGPLSQQFYTYQKITDHDYVAQTTRTSEPGMQYAISLNGTLNENDQYLTKSVQANYIRGYQDDPAENDSCAFTLTQTPDQLSYTGACSRSGAGQSSLQSASYRLFDGNTATDVDHYDPSLLAMGDGALLGTFTGDNWTNAVNQSTLDLHQAWTPNAEMMNLETSATTNDYLESLELLHTPTAIDTQTIEFVPSQTWDCAGTAEAQISRPVIVSAVEDCTSLLALHYTWNEDIGDLCTYDDVPGDFVMDETNTP